MKTHQAGSVVNWRPSGYVAPDVLITSGLNASSKNHKALWEGQSRKERTHIPRGACRCGLRRTCSSVIHDRFQRWTEMGIFEKLMKKMVEYYAKEAGLRWKWQ